jgi:Fe-S cluster biosynthesis and repair protein YggX
MRNMDYKIWFEEESGILRAELKKALYPELAKAIFDDMFGNYTEEQQRYVMVLIGEGAQDMIDKETRKLVRERTMQNTWGRIAIYGANPGIRMLAKIILKAIGKGNDTKFFATEDECREWLSAEIEQDKTLKKTS